jgi:LysR family transcriptional repressor of citA
MNHDDLLTFLTLADCRNFTRTAERLNVVQSTVSNRIRSLEETLGTLLVTRDKSGVLLTPAGEVFLEHAKIIYEQMDAALRETQMQKKYKGNLRIGSIHWGYECFVQKLLEGFAAQHPDISISVTVGHGEELVPMICEKRLDCAVLADEVSSRNVGIRLFRETDTVFAGGRKYAHLAGGISREDVAEQELIYADIWDNYLSELSSGELSDRSIFRLRCNQVKDAKAFCLAGFGCCFLPRPMIEKELADGSLTAIPIEGLQPQKSRLYLAALKAERSYALRCWMDYVGQSR